VQKKKTVKDGANGEDVEVSYMDEHEDALGFRQSNSLV